MRHNRPGLDTFESPRASAQLDEPIQEALRLWPGVITVLLQWLIWWGAPIVFPEDMAGYIWAFAGLIGALTIVVWWAFFSRAPRFERWGAVVVMIAALAATPRILHESVATAGMGMLFFIYATPLLSLAFVVWAVASRGLPSRPRRLAMVATIVFVCAAWTLVRTDGVSSTGSDFRWRWSKTPEERLLAQADDEPALLRSAPVATETRAYWPGFRGANRDAIIPGVRIESDWSASPPIELWRRPIGPGWSSFAVHGDLLYTQEQRGEDEVVSCYKTSTGEPVWRHRDRARFWESNGGAGPRATPTLSDGKVYAFGATGILNVLDARDGTLVWSRNVGSDVDVEVPYWGFSSSPLVIDDIVIIAASGRLAAFDLATGNPRWFGPAGGISYSSPHLFTIDGIPQILLLNGAGATSLAPTTGRLLWEHSWPGSGIVQPALTAEGDILINALGGSGGIGMRRIAPGNGAEGWAIEELWTSNRLKPYFSDFVVHDGHAFGFDGSILACIDVEDGKRKWKGGRYGHGQLVLLPDQDLLLVVSERGELALVAAVPDQFKELARFSAIEGKTWNHPVLVDDLLLVRNGQEMAAFRLFLAGD